MPGRSTTGFVVLTMEFRKEGDIWTGVCKELGTAADGAIFDEVSEVLNEMVLLHLNTLEDVGECKRFLKEHGVTIHRNEPPSTRITIPNDPNRYISSRLIPLGSC